MGRPRLLTGEHTPRTGDGSGMAQTPRRAAENRARVPTKRWTL